MISIGNSSHNQDLGGKILAILLFLLLLYAPIAGFFPLPLPVMQTLGFSMLLIARSEENSVTKR